MKNISIESFYSSINRHILLAESYSEVPELSFIIKSCRLKPYDFLLNKKNTKLVLYKSWVDEYGNSLNILKNKKLKIIYGDLSINRKRIICTDIYNGLSIGKILKISKLASIIYGRDEDIYQDCLIISLLGIDNYIRAYMYLYGEWQQVSPLLIGLKHLKIMANNTDIKYFREFLIKENSPLPCNEAKEWLTCLPASNNLLELLNKQCGIAYTLLNKEP